VTNGIAMLDYVTHCASLQIAMGGRVHSKKFHDVLQVQSKQNMTGQSLSNVSDFIQSASPLR
jgi:hypothetical protein